LNYLKAISEAINPDKSQDWGDERIYGNFFYAEKQLDGSYKVKVRGGLNCEIDENIFQSKK
jgi:hypothetical protein